MRKPIGFNPLDRLQESYKLPEGHVKRKEATEAVVREYQESEKQEQMFCKHLPKSYRRSQSVERLREIILNLCLLTGTKKVPKLCFNSLEVQPMAGAHYCRGEIHFKWEATLVTAIHELAHHIQHMDKKGGSQHGKEFLWIESFLFDVFMEEILPSLKARESMG